MPSPPVQCKKFAKATSQPHHFRIPKQGRQEAGTESLPTVVQPVTDCCGHDLPSKEEKDRGLSAILSPNEASQFHRSTLLALLCKSHHCPIQTWARKEKHPLRCLPTNWSSGALLRPNLRPRHPAHRCQPATQDEGMYVTAAGHGADKGILHLCQDKSVRIQRKCLVH